MEPQAVLVSMLRLIQEAHAIVTQASPGAICIRATLDSSHYIWVNAITGEVRLFPPGEPSLLPSTGSEPAQ